MFYHHNGTSTNGIVSDAESGFMSQGEEYNSNPYYGSGRLNNSNPYGKQSNGKGNPYQKKFVRR